MPDRSCVRKESRPAPVAEPVGAFLNRSSRSAVSAASGRVRVPLHPGPGLVVIAGRNGSGKSTIAEALEMALTGKSYRWLNRTAVWTGNWRNLHGGSDAAIRVEIAEEGVVSPPSESTGPRRPTSQAAQLGATSREEA